MGFWTWAAIDSVGADVRRQGRRQQKLLREQNHTLKRIEDQQSEAASRQARIDNHPAWLQQLRYNTPLGHPGFLSRMDPKWVQRFDEGYAGYPASWSLAVIRIRRELKAAGWDVDQLMAEIEQAKGTGLPPPPSS